VCAMKYVTTWNVNRTLLHRKNISQF
jgi:hypothetical protein